MNSTCIAEQEYHKFYHQGKKHKNFEINQIWAHLHKINKLEKLYLKIDLHYNKHMIEMWYYNIDC